MSPRTSPTVRSSRILIVDDEPSIGKIVASILAAEGHETRVVTNGFECIDAVRAEPFDLLLLDVGMPEMDGFQVCEALAVHQRERRLPIILLTGRTDLETRVSGMHHGVTEYLTKPINRHELVARVRAQLHIVSLSQQLDTIERNIHASPGARDLGQ
jgi:DNA-binding response OmpR family regulator